MGRGARRGEGPRARHRGADALPPEGGKVILITNAPRPKADVIAQLDRLGVPRAAYDDVITSGDAARHVLAARRGVKLYHVGPERDLPIYFGLPVEFADEDDCELVSCTGLFDDENETPDDYRESFADWQARGVPMLCVNPDIVVERGDRLVWCAGALAERYRERGGETIIVGKPYAPIYDTALARLEELAGAAVPKPRCSPSATASTPTSAAPSGRGSTFSSSPAASTPPYLAPAKRLTLPRSTPFSAPPAWAPAP